MSSEDTETIADSLSLEVGDTFIISMTVVEGGIKKLCTRGGTPCIMFEGVLDDGFDGRFT